MKRNSTPRTLKTNSVKSQPAIPSELSLALLRNFARAYCFEPALPFSLGSFINS